MSAFTYHKTTPADMGTASARAMTPRRVTCRYLRRNGEQCTAAAADPAGDVLLCTKHLARALRLIQGRAA